MPGRPTVCGVGGIGSQVRSRLISRSALPTNLRQASLSLFEPPKHLRQLLLLGAPLVRAGQERIVKVRGFPKPGMVEVWDISPQA